MSTFLEITKACFSRGCFVAAESNAQTLKRSNLKPTFSFAFCISLWLDANTSVVKHSNMAFTFA